ncbi:MAG: arginine--tRNA ligase [Myxococcales bacterium]|nr:arginine--tRNA ligase [Myxococcales bacterium]
MHARIKEHLTSVLMRLQDAGELPSGDLPTIDVILAKQPEHGDFATNIAFKLAPLARRSPAQIGERLVAAIGDGDGLFSSVEFARPGFINFRIATAHWFSVLGEIAARGAQFGTSDAGAGQRVLLEFVSANPTGPLHVGHGRGAVVGDVLGNLMQAAGYHVEREYYVNDVGNQIRLLARSLYFRYAQLLGREIELPENHYQGEYVIEIAQRFREAHGDGQLDVDADALPPLFRAFIVDDILADIRDDLGRFGIGFDRWYQEHELYDSKWVERVLDKLRTEGLLYDEDGKMKYRVSQFDPNEADRVVIRDNGVPTYFASDIAYHDEKFARGFDTLINIWGADHHGYIGRVRAALTGLGHDASKLEILLVQFVNLVRGAEQVSMSTRSGQFVTLREVVDEVGADATRYFFLMRKMDAQMDFDLELAKKRSLENPVFYAQYGHARLCTMLKRGAEGGHQPAAFNSELAGLLTLPEELDIVKRLWRFSDVIAQCAAARETHPLVFYISELIKVFHGYFTRYKHTEKVISEDAAKTAARLHLCVALRTVLANGLALLGVSAPEWMEPPAETEEE